MAGSSSDRGNYFRDYSKIFIQGQEEMFPLIFLKIALLQEKIPDIFSRQSLSQNLVLVLMVQSRIESLKI